MTSQDFVKAAEIVSEYWEDCPYPVDNNTVDIDDKPYMVGEAVESSFLEFFSQDENFNKQRFIDACRAKNRLIHADCLKPAKKKKAS